MSKKLSFTFSTTPDHKPVAFLDDMPNCGTELSPAVLRSIAQALIKAADECESIGSESGQGVPQRRSYSLDAVWPVLVQDDENLCAAMREVLELTQREQALA
jgi:hypothetical protein